MARFVRNLPRSPADQLIVKAVSEMARGFGSDVGGGVRRQPRETVELLPGLRCRVRPGLLRLVDPEPLALS